MYDQCLRALLSCMTARRFVRTYDQCLCALIPCMTARRFVLMYDQCLSRTYSVLDCTSIRTYVRPVPLRTDSVHDCTSLRTHVRSVPSAHTPRTKSIAGYPSVFSVITQSCVPYSLKDSRLDTMKMRKRKPDRLGGYESLV